MTSANAQNLTFSELTPSLPPDMLKSITATLLASAGLVFAGDFYEGAGGVTPDPIAPSSFGGGGFFIGGGAEYMFDAGLDAGGGDIDFGEVLYTGHLGYDLGNNSSVFVEGGWMSGDQSIPLFGNAAISVDSQVIPITVNYELKIPMSSALSFYVGGGAGVALADIELGFLGQSQSADAHALALQGRAGMIYSVSEAFEIYAGARYFWTDDFDFGQATGELEGFSNFSLGGGIRINF